MEYFLLLLNMIIKWKLIGVVPELLDPEAKVERMLKLLREKYNGFTVMERVLIGQDGTIRANIFNVFGKNQELLVGVLAEGIYRLNKRLTRKGICVYYEWTKLFQHWIAPLNPEHIQLFLTHPVSKKSSSFSTVLMRDAPTILAKKLVSMAASSVVENIDAMFTRGAKDDQPPIQLILFRPDDERGEIMGHLLTTLDERQLFRLLHATDLQGNNFFHTSLKRGISIGRILTKMATQSTCLNELIGARNNSGQNILHCSSGIEYDFIDIMRLYKNYIGVGDLLEKLEVQDENGNIPLHFIMEQELLYLMAVVAQTREFDLDVIIKLLEVRNTEGHSAADFGDKSKQTLTSLVLAGKNCKCSRYPFIKQPAVLIISNTRHRPNASEESRSIKSAFEGLGYRYVFKENLTKAKMLASIRGISDCEYGQIVIIMSHGSKGVIQDVYAAPVGLSYIERTMLGREDKTPKVLILQCCQQSPTYFSSCDSEGDIQYIVECTIPTQSNVPELPDAPYPGTDNYSDYVLKGNNFLVMKSCLSGQTSYRNHFIPKLAERLKPLNGHKDLMQVFYETKSAMESEKTDQIPIVYTTLSGCLCLGVIYDSSTTPDRLEANPDAIDSFGTIDIQGQSAPSSIRRAVDPLEALRREA